MGKKSKSRSSSSESSDTSSSGGDSADSEKYRKEMKKIKQKLKKEERRREKKLKKKLKKEKRKLKKEQKKKYKDSKEKEGQVEVELETEEKTATEKSCNIPIKLMEASKAMAPMTKEEWEKKQSVVRRVLDEETGRYRLIKGDGEVLEEIVSYKRHKDINKQANQADGDFFESQTVKKKAKY